MQNSTFSSIPKSPQTLEGKIATSQQFLKHRITHASASKTKKSPISSPSPFGEGFRVGFFHASAPKTKKSPISSPSPFGEGFRVRSFSTPSNLFSTSKNKNMKHSFSILHSAISIIFLLLTHLTHAQRTFAPQVTYATGTNPRSVAIGDLTGDGRADLAVVNRSSNTVSVYTNTGSGSFAPQVTYATGSFPRSVAIGDLNGDGRADLAVANSSSNTVSVLTNTGSGSFAPQVTYATGSNPYSVAIGDLTGDGRADLAVANYGSNTVSVLTNTGSGSFAPQVTYATGSSPYSVSIGNLNNDSYLDLAVANFSSNTVSILTGTGTGSFGTRVDYATGINPRSVTFGDLNNDSHLDLCISSGTSSQINLVSVLTNTGGGIFNSKIDYITDYDQENVAIGDINNDNKLDLIVAATPFNNAVQSTAVIGLINDGFGQFTINKFPYLNTGPRSVFIGDLNSDNKADLITANQGSNTISVLLAQDLQFIGGFSVANQVYGNTFAFNATATSGLPVSYSSSNPSIINIVGSAATATGVGVVTVTAFQSGNGSFLGVTTTGVLTVTKANLAVQGNNATKVYGSPNPAFTSSVSGLVLGNTVNITYSTTATPSSNVGNYPINISLTGAALANYNLSIVNSQLSITPANQSVTLSPISNITLIGLPVVITVSGSASSGLPVSLSSSPALAINGLVLTVTSAGIYTITGTQAGNGNYYAANPVSVIFQAIVLPTISGNNYGIGNTNPVEACTANKFTYSIIASNTVPSGIIGYEIRIPYNPILVQPTGINTFGEVLTNTGAPLRIFTTVTTISGQVFYVVNLFANFTFTGVIASGVGTILNVEFALQSAISPQVLSLTGVISESTILTSTNLTSLTPNVLNIIPNDINKVRGTLLGYSLNNKPIQSLGASKTVLFGALGSVLGSSLQTLSGNTFSVSLPVGSDGIGIVRNFDDGAIVNPVINSNDALITQRIVNGMPPFNVTSPTILQLIAADVNSDGRVQLSDWILIQQRAINTIGTFPNSPDWKFIETTRLITFTGQNNFNFPLANAIVSVSQVNNANGCSDFGDRAVTGVLVGDVDGNWNTATHSNTFRTEGETEVVYKFTESVVDDSANEVKVPVYVAYSEALSAIDVDLDYDETNFEIKNVELPQSQSPSNCSMQYNDFQNKRLLISSLSFESFDISNPVLYITFKGKTTFTGADFKEVNSYLAGNKVSSRLELASQTNAIKIDSNPSKPLSVLPNPNKGSFVIFTSSNKSLIEIYNSIGMLVKSIISPNDKENVSELPSGMYLIKVGKETIKVIVE